MRDFFCACFCFASLFLVFSTKINLWCARLLEWLTLLHYVVRYTYIVVVGVVRFCRPVEMQCLSLFAQLQKYDGDLEVVFTKCSSTARAHCFVVCFAMIRPRSWKLFIYFLLLLLSLLHRTALYVSSTNAAAYRSEWVIRQTNSCWSL